MSRVRDVVRRAVAPVRRLAGRVVHQEDRRFRYVFVVTYGRSGSTLVQGLLNTLPRTLVRGENNFYVLSQYRSMAATRGFRKLHLRHNPRAVHSAFYGLHEIRPASFVKSTHDLMTGHMLGSVPPYEVDVLGFKEVLWHRIRPEETQGFFDFMDKVFPDCQYILNERDAERVVGSGFWQSRDTEKVLKTLHRVEEIQEFLRGTRKDRVLDLRYELVTSDDRAVSDEQLRRIAEFVHGSCDDELLERLRVTRATGHGPFPFGKSRGRF